MGMQIGVTKTIAYLGLLDGMFDAAIGGAAKPDAPARSR